MNGIVKLECGCIGIVLPEEQHQNQGSDYPDGDFIVLDRCDNDIDQPAEGFWVRHIEHEKVATAKLLTAGDVGILAKALDRLISEGHSLRTVRALLREPKA